MQLKKGERLGPYEVVGLLGAGGMGEVYEARDTRLSRAVAIKILPTDLSQDPKLRLRFEREAKAISSLSHPHICALYDVGEVSSAQGGPLQYMVMEFLDGETLEKRLSRGPLSLDHIIQYALQIADALDKAHRKQILHRDLKPSNIMITASGARLFDFGLSKLFRASIPEVISDAATPERSITAEGSVVGTVEYMAPELLEGKEPDARTDVFSFGVCLYQMITGRRPFEATSRAGVIAAILEHDPPAISTHRPAIPPSLEWLVKNCLAKDPDERLQTAHDVLLELRRIAEECRSSVPTARRRKARWWVYPGVTAVAIFIAMTVLIAVRSNRPRSVTLRERRFSIALPADAPLSGGPFEKLAVSSDGTRIVYVGGAGDTRLYLYSMNTQETRPLLDTEAARGPFFSPDGEWIGFYTANRELKKLWLEKGTVTTLATGKDLRGANWGQDGSIVIGEISSPLRRIPASGGSAEALGSYDPQAEIRWPSFLPGAQAVIYTASDFSGDYENAKLVALSLKTGKTKILLNGATYGRYVPTGHLIYLHSHMLFAVPFKQQTLTVTGPPTPLVSDVDSYFGTGVAHFAVASDGSLFYLSRDPTESDRELVWVDRKGNLTRATSSRRAYQDPRISPDGKRILVTVGVRPRSDLWIYDFDRDAWTRLTTEATNVTGFWSPDGRQIAFASNKNGGFALYVMPGDGSGPPKQITGRRGWDFPTSWSPDGRTIAVVEQYRSTLEDIFLVVPEAGATPRPLIATPFSERAAVFSPDGRWIAHQSNESGRDEIYVQSSSGRGRKWLVSTQGGSTPAWRADGKELFYRNGNAMMSVATRLGSDFSVGKPEVLFRGDFDEEYDVAPDGGRFLMVKVPPPTVRTKINVVLGLFDSLQPHDGER